MKKLFVVLAIGAFAACNNSASTETKSADSTKVDSTVAATAAATDSTVKAADSTVKAADSTVKAAEKKVDSLKK
ncbi:hypothetical protein [Pinibacter soli]|uniref:Entericidin n=1 Tax=Pinibacter soli TaxID=3044211 RepID=A0ABT6RGT7_9BACT|nr:hypothetical protein [Pinibacter soli]MDI3321775.1 hypothetical protein [Pinibacter soli]